MSKPIQSSLNSKFSLKNIRQLLLKRQKKVQAEIKDLEKSDPVLANSIAESSEIGTDSWMADVHTRATAAKESLKGILEGITKALNNLKLGKYGKCEKCGKNIEKERLEAMPSATLCINCSKKTKK